MLKSDLINIITKIDKDNINERLTGKFFFY